MAASAKKSRPGVIVTVFVLIIAGMYVIMGLTKTWTPKLGLDLRGGQTITLTATNSAVTEESMELARDIIQERVDGLGVGEASVAVQGDREIVVSAPNVERDDLVELVGATAQVSFRPVLQQAQATGSVEEPTDENGNPLPGLPTAPPSKEAEKKKEDLLSVSDALKYTATQQEQQAFNEYVCGEEQVETARGALIACDEEKKVKYLLGPVAVAGERITSADSGIPQGDLAYAVTLKLDSEGTTRFSEFTGALTKNQQPTNLFGIVLDGVVRWDIRAETQISNGEAVIRGDFNADEAMAMANVLKFGSLPLDFTPSQVETVSPTLGGEQLRVGIIAGVLGLIVVALYSFLYYRGMGFVVLLSLVVAAAATYASMVLLGSVMGFALNLPGIAGAIVGIAVTADSFIIFFERIRDEIREGRSLRSALVSGWTKARGTIVISDAVSMLSAIVLFILAVGSVKGFAFTLGLTTLLDLAVVFFFTRPLVELLGRTKFFGEGHAWSGLDAEHMGVSRDSLLGRRARRRTASTKAQEA